MASHEYDGRSFGRPGIRNAETSEVDAVSDQLVASSKSPLRRGYGLRRHGTSNLQAIGECTRQRTERRVKGTSATPVKRPDLRRLTDAQARIRRARRERLVKVQHIELSSTKRAESADRRPRPEGDGRYRAVGPYSHRSSEPNDVVFVVVTHPIAVQRSVQRSEDGCMMSEPPKFACESNDLALHTSGDTQAVRAVKSNPQVDDRPVRPHLRGDRSDRSDRSDRRGSPLVGCRRASVAARHRSASSVGRRATGPEPCARRPRIRTRSPE